MEKFYFTFGREKEHPYQGGWVEILAENREQAKEIFKAEYPNRPGSSFLIYAFDYTEERFLKTSMVNGNLGAKCHAVHKFDDYKQVCVWPGTTLGDSTPEDFVENMRERFGIRIIFVRLFKLIPAGMICFSESTDMTLVNLLLKEFRMESAGGKTFLAMAEDVNILRKF